MADTGPLDAFWRTAYRFGFPLARVWWRLRRAQHEGALVAVYVDRGLLLLRSSYRAEWNFPGGAVKSGETPDVAAARELVEEIGLVSRRRSAPPERPTASGTGGKTGCTSSNCDWTGCPS